MTIRSLMHAYFMFMIMHIPSQVTVIVAIGG